MKLTKSQKAIVEFLDGPILVTAGPGSGKTSVLTQRIANILEKRKGKILALTFSNKAAEEIKERVNDQVLLEDLNRVKVETIHSFGLDIITNKGNLIGLPSKLSVIEESKDKLELIKRVFLDAKNSLPDDKTLRETLRRIQKNKQQFISPEMIEKNVNNIDFINIYESYNNLLLNNRVIDFDDILFYSYKILVERPKVASNYTRLYKYILVDEAQDLNNSQYKILKALTRNFFNIMMVGDPDQSIYGFNGSDSNIMVKKFAKDFNPKIYSLNENFRSTSKIIEAAKKLQPNSNSQSVFPLEGVLEVISFEDEVEEAEWIAEKINSIKNNGSPWLDDEVKLENIAVIGRNKYLFKNIEEVFRDSKLDYSFGNSAANAESETIEMKIFEAGIRVLVNPYDDLHYSKINSYLSRVDNDNNEDHLEDLLNNKELNNLDVNEKIFSSVMEAWNVLHQNNDNFLKGLRVIEENLKDKIIDENFMFLIQNDINLWKQRWEKYCKSTVKGDRSLSYFRNQVSLGKMNNDSSSGVSFLTVHMSKGLEFDVVFIIGLTQGTFPDYRVKTDVQRQEELNNMFVAVTRAKRECYLTYPENKMMPWGTTKRQQPSEYLNIITE
ncbi:DNA helicase UvrD [Bacillus xiamenensis]|uniref:DNA 3'-5' helicase n=1 Tax=Bacillus xiamenensis TaxID=1178537 RepID=A0ABT4EXQ5_9BACI|nr:ATP-dependent helicase [Bacillus xiamenensis]MBG9911960.1 DNA helicase UvrD [Bacillus xiamenensis]MCY9574470.1 ATP-dependent helicase [Bacillus xiamenensis]